ncbi:hypothetical protein ABI59_19655 [Acidobacteria bacterium Mor1]|nr:hypothetical protein ABI59_19655 [Acidobacteria bacterium Mor1]
MDYGRAIRVIRAARGLSQQELARKARINPSYLSLIESNKRQPSTAKVKKIADALGVPLHLLTLFASDQDDLESLSAEEGQLLAKKLLAILMDAEDAAE